MNNVFGHIMHHFCHTIHQCVNFSHIFTDFGSFRTFSLLLLLVRNFPFSVRNFNVRKLNIRNLGPKLFINNVATNQFFVHFLCSEPRKIIHLLKAMDLSFDLEPFSMLFAVTHKLSVVLTQTVREPKPSPCNASYRT